MFGSVRQRKIKKFYFIYFCLEDIMFIYLGKFQEFNQVKKLELKKKVNFMVCWCLKKDQLWIMVYVYKFSIYEVEKGEFKVLDYCVYVNCKLLVQYRKGKYFIYVLFIFKDIFILFF